MPWNGIGLSVLSLPVGVTFLELNLVGTGNGGPIAAVPPLAELGLLAIEALAWACEPLDIKAFLRILDCLALGFSEGVGFRESLFRGLGAESTVLYSPSLRFSDSSSDDPRISSEEPGNKALIREGRIFEKLSLAFPLPLLIGGGVAPRSNSSKGSSVRTSPPKSGACATGAGAGSFRVALLELRRGRDGAGPVSGNGNGAVLDKRAEGSNVGANLIVTGSAFASSVCIEVLRKVGGDV